MKRGVVFDLDGVLVMSEHLWEEAWTVYAGKHGYIWTAGDTMACQGMSVPEWSAYLAKRSSLGAERAAEAVIGHVVQAYRDGKVSLLDGAARMVAAVAERVPIGLASSAPREIIDTVMTTMGIGTFFSATVSSAEVARGKPSPDVYVEAITRLRIEAAWSAAVEDSSNGVRAAAAAGLRVVAVAHDEYPIAADALALVESVHRTLGGVQDALIRMLDNPAMEARPR